MEAVKVFRIGDFSRLARVSIRMLRYYDELGILKPHYTDEITGYRFYSSTQIALVNRIQVLREMGFSLVEIAQLMEKELESRQLKTLLENRKRVIEENIKSENEKLLRVCTLIELINKEELGMNYDIAIKQIPEYKILSLRDTIKYYSEEGKLRQELNDFIEENKIKSIFPYYTIYHDKGYKECDIDVEVSVCIQEDIQPTKRIKVRTLEEIKEMAVVFHKGPFEDMSLAFHALGKWMDANGYEGAGAVRAIYHKGHWCEKDPAKFLTEIQMPIVKRKG